MKIHQFWMEIFNFCQFFQVWKLLRFIFKSFSYFFVFLPGHKKVVFKDRKSRLPISTKTLFRWLRITEDNSEAFCGINFICRCLLPACLPFSENTFPIEIVFESLFLWGYANFVGEKGLCFSIGLCLGKAVESYKCFLHERTGHLE